MDDVARHNKIKRVMKRSTDADKLWSSEEGRRNLRSFYAHLCNKYQALLSIRALTALKHEEYVIETSQLIMKIKAGTLPHVLRKAFWPKSARGESGYIATLQRELLESNAIKLGEFQYEDGLTIKSLRALSKVIEQTHEYWSIQNTIKNEPLLTRMIIGARLLSEFSIFPSFAEVTAYKDHILGVIAARELRYFREHTKLCDVLELSAGTKQPFDGPEGLKRLERYIIDMAKTQGYLLNSQSLKLLCHKHSYDTVRKALKKHGFDNVSEFQAELMRRGKLEFQTVRNQGALRIDPGKRGTFAERLMANLFLMPAFDRRLRELGLEPTVDAQCYVTDVAHRVDFVIGKRFIVEVMGGVTSEQMFGDAAVPESQQFVPAYIDKNRDYLEQLKCSSIPHVIIGLEDCETRASAPRAREKILKALDYYFDGKPTGQPLEYEPDTDVACDYSETGLANWLRETPFFEAGSCLLPSRNEFALISSPKWPSVVVSMTLRGTSTVCGLAGLHYESRLPSFETLDLTNPKNRRTILESHFGHLDYLPKPGYWHSSLKPLDEFYRQHGSSLATSDAGKPWLTKVRSARSTYKNAGGYELDAIAEAVCSLRPYALGHPLFPSRQQLEHEGKSGAYKPMIEVLSNPELKRKLCELTNLMTMDDFLERAMPIAERHLHERDFVVTDNLKRALTKHLSREANNEWRMRKESRFSRFFTDHR